MKKYRGKCVGDQRWVYGSYLYTDDNINQIFRQSPIIEKHTIVQYEPCDWNLGHWAYYDVIPESVGIFTGKLDKNDKEVYVGDIIKKIYHPLGTDPKIIEYYSIGVVVYPFYIMWKIEGTNVLNPDLNCLGLQTEKKRHVHPTEGLDWIDTYEHFALFNDEIIGNIIDNPDLII